MGAFYCGGRLGARCTSGREFTLKLLTVTGPGERSLGLSLDQFLAKRGGSAIVARGRALKQSNAALFASIRQRFGVPSGPFLAIWGMETLREVTRESERSIGGGNSRL
jgi:hypothetical protein